MRPFLVIALASATCVSSAQFTFYNGDPDTGQGWSSQHGGEVTDSRVYDDFTLGTRTEIRSLYGNFLDTSNNNRGDIPIYFELRQGVVGAEYPDSGTGGTLVVGGYTQQGSRTDTGIRISIFKVYRYEVFLLDYFFDPGTYWLTIAPDLSGISGGTWIASTRGGGRTGGYIADGLDTLDSTTWGYSWVTLGDEVSYGITSLPAPEPASLAALAIGALLLRRRSTSATRP